MNQINTSSVSCTWAWQSTHVAFDELDGTEIKNIISRFVVYMLLIVGVFGFLSYISTIRTILLYFWPTLNKLKMETSCLLNPCGKLVNKECKRFRCSLNYLSYVSLELEQRTQTTFTIGVPFVLLTIRLEDSQSAFVALGIVGSCVTLVQQVVAQRTNLYNLLRIKNKHWEFWSLRNVVLLK